MEKIVPPRCNYDMRKEPYLKSYNQEVYPLSKETPFKKIATNI